MARCSGEGRYRTIRLDTVCTSTSASMSLACHARSKSIITSGVESWLSEKTRTERSRGGTLPKNSLGWGGVRVSVHGGLDVVDLDG